MFDIVIVGAGGFGREVFLWAQGTFPANEFKFKGFLCKNPTELDKFDGMPPILGDEKSYEIGIADRFLLAIGHIGNRNRALAVLKEKGAKFLTLIHPTTIVAKTAQIGEGVVICPYSIVSDHVVVGNFVLMNLYVSCGHDVRIGNGCVLNPYAFLAGGSILEEDVYLGMHATVAGKRVGSKSKISANSVAMHDIPPNSLVSGVPGKSKKILVLRGTSESGLSR